MKNDTKELIAFIRQTYNTEEGVVPLHAPVFVGKEKEYLNDCIDSTYVSTIGSYVEAFEQQLCSKLQVKHAVAVVNGTSALHAALLVAGVQPGEEVLTQALTFVATANAIQYCGAGPVFLDVDESTLGLSPQSVARFLANETEKKQGMVVNKKTGRRVAACVPVHTFGHPCRIEELMEVCSPNGVPVIEDAAEALGSLYHKQACGTFGAAGVLSFNGNKIITSGGGGAIVTNDKAFAQQARYLTTTAKKNHPYTYEHTEVGYNYRMPNINAALACAQLEFLDHFVAQKRLLAHRYMDFFVKTAFQFMVEPDGAQSNYWLNAFFAHNLAERKTILKETNRQNILTRPPWKLLNFLPMYRACQTDELSVSRKAADLLVNIPSSVPL